MPEGDSIHRAARRLQVLVGERVDVETPHPQAAVERLAERLDGRRLEAVDAVGKNLLLTFEGGLVLRSHLRMRGRWQVRPRDGRPRRGKPWLVLQSADHEALLWNGPVLELSARATRRLGPDILAGPPDVDAMVGNLRREHPERELGDALLDQRLVGGGPLARADLSLALARRGLRRRARARAARGSAADAGIGRDRARGAEDLPASWPPVPALRHPDPLARPGRRQSDRLLVSGLPKRRGGAGRVGSVVPVRAPHLYRSLRSFCLAGFSVLAADVEAGDEIPFAFEEHGAGRGRASLYEYRPLVRSYVDARAERLGQLADARIALEELEVEPAAGVYAATHAGRRGRG